ncbi:MAG: NTP transferase domain-containing protein [Gemmatimonadales bacterium]
MSQARRFAGVVPSAGASLRMGRTKALLEVGGRTFLARTVAALRSGGCDPVLVVVPDGEPATRIAEAAERAGALVLRNPDPGEGPITSLRLAIRELGDSVAGLAYLPVDHPMVKAQTVAALLAAARAAVGGRAALTIPMHRGRRGHPAVFGSALFTELADPALEGGARMVVHRHLDHATLVEVDDPGVLTDIDTPEAYAAVVG